jgi:DNA-directed RNA polymerase subunit M/transcription elongation factor TFIIS
MEEFMAEQIAYSEFKCPKCGHDFKMAYQAGGVFAQAPSAKVQCDACGHSWDHIFPDKPLK